MNILWWPKKRMLPGGLGGLASDALEAFLCRASGGFSDAVRRHRGQTKSLRRYLWGRRGRLLGSARWSRRLCRVGIRGVRQAGSRTRSWGLGRVVHREAPQRGPTLTARFSGRLRLQGLQLDLRLLRARETTLLSLHCCPSSRQREWADRILTCITSCRLSFSRWQMRREMVATSRSCTAIICRW